MRRERGFALLIVLWTLVFVTFLLTQIMATGRGALNLAANLRAAAISQATADGAINAAILHLLATGPAQWQQGGPAHLVTVAGTPVAVQVRSLAGTVNPNLASAALMAGLLQAVSVPPEQAATLGGAIMSWHSPAPSLTAAAAALAAYRRAGLFQAPAGKPFTSLAELNDVLGMTPDIYARLVPHLSLYTSGDPDPNAADAIVTRAITLAGAASTSNAGYIGAPVADITACLASGLCRHAVVSLPGASAYQPFRILAMDNAH